MTIEDLIGQQRDITKFAMSEGLDRILSICEVSADETAGAVSSMIAARNVFVATIIRCERMGMPRDLSENLTAGLGAQLQAMRGELENDEQGH